jgi:hypothetical protein
MRKNVGSSSRQSAEHFRETRFVRITHGGFAIRLDPFGMLNPKIVVNLLLEFGVGVDLMRHGNWPRSKIQVRRGSYRTKGSARMADGNGCRKRPPRPGEDIPKGGAHMLALCTSAGQLGYFVLLALQQHSQQSALCKGRG